MKPVTRREFVRRAALAAAGARLVGAAAAADLPVLSPVVPSTFEPLRDGVARLHWLEGQPAIVPVGVTLGVPWPRGRLPKLSTFALRRASGESVPVQSWPLATWPDGSLKWSAHAVPADVPLDSTYELAPGTPSSPARPLVVRETPDSIEIDTGVMRCEIGRNGAALIRSLQRGGKVVARDGRLVGLRQSTPELAAGVAVTREEFESEIASAVVEQSGPVRSVVKIEGHHRQVADSAAGQGAPRAWLPFVVRLYFSSGSEAVRIVHTFIFDGDEKSDFIAGLGVRFRVPLHDPRYDRHVRFAGENGGLWAEAVQGITGLRRDPGEAVRSAQIAGRACPPLPQWDKRVANGLKYVPAWGDVTLAQLSADGFEIRKRTQEGCGWIGAGAGRRAGGLAYLGGASGGVAFGLRHFWQSHPTQFDIRGGAGDEADVAVWMWSPEAQPMDLRFYHDGMGQDSYEKQLEGLNVTYEDYEPGFGAPHGIARTSELMLYALEATPSRERFVQFAAALETPPLLVCRPEYYASLGLFGGIWNVVDRRTPARARIEDQLDFFFDYYRKHVEQHHWYGFWNYGDVRHTYDYDRHVWRYDVGGFAWDNSELSPDLWLWYAFLRSGRADIFRVAEAMTRHTGEVDVYHLGRFRGLGTRHGVQHWGDSAKQVRISTAVYRRFFYYLTADERVGDLMHELVGCDERLVDISPGRKVHRNAGDRRYPADVSFGTDWCSFAAAWLTEWERTGDTKWRDKLLTGMKCIGTMPRGWLTGGGGYDPKTGMLYPHNDRPSVSHLNAVFGAVEVSAELLQLLDAPEYERAWLQYCEVYNAEPEEQRRLVGETFENHTLRQGHARLTAYAAFRKRDPALAARAWQEFAARDGEGDRAGVPVAQQIVGPAVLNPVDEAPRVSTNGTAQFGLSAIQCLALVGEALKE